MEKEIFVFVELEDGMGAAINLRSRTVELKPLKILEFIIHLTQTLLITLPKNISKGLKMF